MGDIKKIRKKYSKPSHPWRMQRIEEEGTICREYGIPRRTELWKAKARLESFKNQAKSLSALSSSQADIQRDNLYKKLQNYGLIKSGESSDAILGISLKDLLNRRLQTVVQKKGFAKTMSQARQLIVHRHVLISSRIISSPSYMVRLAEEGSVEISPKSPFYDIAHPERSKEASKRKPYVPQKKDSRRRDRK